MYMSKGSSEALKTPKRPMFMPKRPMFMQKRPTFMEKDLWKRFRDALVLQKRKK